MKKKILTLVLAAIMALAALAGCSEKQSGTVSTDGSTSMEEVIGVLGEAMAVMMVSGNAPNMPSLFESVRFLTTAVASEMSYSSGLQQQALLSIALVFIKEYEVVPAG